MKKALSLLLAVIMVISVFSVCSFAADAEVNAGTNGAVQECKHSQTKWVCDFKATVYADGQKHLECTNCKKVLKVVVIPQLTPDAPVLKRLSNGFGGTVLSWNVVDGAKEYLVYRRAAGENWVLIKRTKGTVIADYGVKSGTLYKYVVRAVGEVGLSKYDNAKLIRYVDAPTGIKAVNFKNEVKVSWKGVAGATSYNIYRKEADAKTWSYIGSSKSTKFTDKSTSAGKKYLYTVRAISNGYYSNFVANDFVRLTNPVLDTAKSGREGITVSWKSVEGAQGYKLYRKVGNGSWSLIGTIDTPRSTAYLDKSTKKGVTYTYTVNAYADSSVSSHSSKGITCKDIH